MMITNGILDADEQQPHPDGFEVLQNEDQQQRQKADLDDEFSIDFIHRNV